VTRFELPIPRPQEVTYYSGGLIVTNLYVFEEIPFCSKRSHRTDQEEFYQLLSYTNNDDLNEKLKHRSIFITLTYLITPLKERHF